MLYGLDFVHKDGETRYLDDTHIKVFYLGHIGERPPIPVRTPASVMRENSPTNLTEQYVLSCRGMYEVRSPDGNSVKFTFIVTNLQPLAHRVIFHSL